MDSPSGARPKLAAKGGDVAGENHMPPRLKNQIKNKIEEAEQHRSNNKRKKIVADLSNGSDSELNGNSMRKKKKPIDQVSIRFIYLFNFSLMI
jgi:hypothetical protein